MRRVRQGTVEPVFGNLIYHYGLRRMNVRGLTGAHKIMLLTALAFNLKAAQVPPQSETEPSRGPASAPAGGQQARQAAVPALGSAHSGPRQAAFQKVNRPNRVLQQPQPYNCTTWLSTQPLANRAENRPIWYRKLVQQLK